MASDPLVLDDALGGADLAAGGHVEAVAFAGHFGALHRPAAGLARGTTVVLCAPIGRDARCAYRPLFLFAEALAARGYAVLRYDHLGGGDSLPVEPEADHWPLWAAGVEQAVDFARAVTGDSALVLAGLRIGASLAALAAESVRPDALMLLAPVASGKAWARELQMAAAMAGLEASADGSVEIDGLRLSRATLASLQGFDLKTLGAPTPAIPTFLATPAPDPRLAASLGPAVAAAPFEGYAELFMEAHLNSPPTAVFETAAAWLDGLNLGAPRPAAPAPASAPPAQLATADWTERPVVFGEGLRGVLCLPSRPGGARAVIFGNTGGDPRAGIGGFATRACRALAAGGVAALRFDFAGLGESASRGAWRPHVYETSRTGDLRAAAELLAQHGYPDVVVAGVCAGGYQALHAAIEDDRFRRVMAINSWLVWRPHDPLQLQRPPAPVRRRVNVFAVLRPAGWRRLLSGEVAVTGALATLSRRLRRHLSFRRPDATGRAIRAAIARLGVQGTEIRVLVGRDDESMDGLEADFGLRGRWLARQRGVELVAIPDLDHGLFSTRSQELALAELFRFVGLPAPPRRPTSAWPRRTRLRRAAKVQPAL